MLSCRELGGEGMELGVELVDLRLKGVNLLGVQ